MNRDSQILGCNLEFEKKILGYSDRIKLNFYLGLPITCQVEFDFELDA